MIYEYRTFPSETYMHVGFLPLVSMKGGDKPCPCGEAAWARVSGLGHPIGLTLGRQGFPGGRLVWYCSHWRPRITDRSYSNINTGTLTTCGATVLF